MANPPEIEYSREIRCAPGYCVEPTHVRFVHDIGENTKAQIGLFTDDEAFYGVIKDCNNAESPQQDLNTLAH